MAHFPAFRSLINDMNCKNVDREHFKTLYARVTFDVIISLDVHPYEMLIGGRGINWACLMEISDDLENSMPDDSFFALRNKLDLKGNGIESFGSYIFLKFISEHLPKYCSGLPVQPSVMQRWYPNKTKMIDEGDRTVFYRWVDQSKKGNEAHNFDKTERYFGKKVADYCRVHNISSQCLTPEDAEKMHIQMVKYPWDK